MPLTSYPFHLLVTAYFYNTIDYKLELNGEEEKPDSIILSAFTDVSYFDCNTIPGIDDTNNRSFDTYGFFIKINNCPILWKSKSKRQTIVVKSTRDAEAVAASLAADGAMRIRLLLQELGFPQHIPTQRFEDKEDIIAVVNNNKAFLTSGRYVAIKAGFLAQLNSDNEIKFFKLKSEDQAADGFTKPLPKIKHHTWLSQINLVNYKIQKEWLLKIPKTE